MVFVLDIGLGATLCQTHPTKHSNQIGDWTLRLEFVGNSVTTGWASRVLLARNVEHHVTKFAPHKILMFLASGKFTFDERFALHRVVSTISHRILAALSGQSPSPMISTPAFERGSAFRARSLQSISSTRVGGFQRIPLLSGFRSQARCLQSGLFKMRREEVDLPGSW